jgi:hypothetical protein
MFGALTRGSRRRAITAAATALAAMALAAAVAGRGCSVAAAGPAEVVRDFAAAASAGDRRAVFELLSPETQARLERQASQATALAGSAMRYEALDLISICSGEDCPAPQELVVKERSADRAVVEVVQVSGERAELTVVRVDGHWRIDLPAYGTGL